MNTEKDPCPGCGNPEDECECCIDCENCPCECDEEFGDDEGE